jgi:hypothetical protein
MDKNPSDHKALTGNLSGGDPVPREMEHERMPALAWKTTPVPRPESPAADQQTKRESTRAAGTDRQDAILDSISEVKQWDPVPGSTGLQIPESPSEDEDDEGRSESEQLVDRGVADAERDQIVQAALATGKKGQPEP